MTLEEINREINDILANKDIEGVWHRFEQLMEEKDVINNKGIVFHYSAPITPAEIQLAAKILKAVLEDDAYASNVSKLDCPKPDEIKGDWNIIPDSLRANESSRFFYIETPEYGKLKYCLKRSRQILDIEGALGLISSQEAFDRIRKNKVNNYMEVFDILCSDFILINSSLINFFLGRDQEISDVRYYKKYNPCIIDRNRILNLKGLLSDQTYIKEIIISDWKELDKSVTSEKIAAFTTKFESDIDVCQRFILSDYSKQVKFLTFWVSLLDVASFPGLPDSYKEIYKNLITYILENYSNIHIYDIVLEQHLVSNSDNTEDRKSDSNTTRIKIFYTTQDDIPRLIRLDLPHKEHPYVHINLENDQNGENDHIRISPDEKSPGEFDQVFDMLQNNLQLYNFFSTTVTHSPVSYDKEMFKEMRYWIAMYTYAVAAYSYYTIGRNERIQQLCLPYKPALIELLKEDGIDEKESADLSPADLFELACSNLEKKGYISF